ncbi:hypothetical protein BJ170DRAFT_176203 [Xylariales sp. AK1849]|nr:hypothetical protein BJ170DRAFT_176203 [Xylariales sp. AK1849]
MYIASTDWGPGLLSKNWYQTPASENSIVVNFHDISTLKHHSICWLQSRQEHHSHKLHTCENMEQARMNQADDMQYCESMDDANTMGTWPMAADVEDYDPESTQSPYSTAWDVMSQAVTTPGPTETMSPATPIGMLEESHWDFNSDMPHNWERFGGCDKIRQSSAEAGGIDPKQTYLNPADPYSANYLRPNAIPQIINPSLLESRPAERVPENDRTTRATTTARPRRQRNSGDEEALYCSTCEIPFPRPTELHKHQKWHEKPLSCESCVYRTDNDKDLNRHRSSCKPEQFGKPRIPCGIGDCGKDFSRRDNQLKHHQNIHGLPRPTPRGRGES